MNLWLFGLVAVVVIMASRAIGLPRLRRLAVTALRLTGLACLVLALRGCSVWHHAERPRHVVYLVDQSASIDPAQTQWIARRLASLEAIRPPQVSRTMLVFGSHAAPVFPTARAALTDERGVAQALGVAPIPRGATNLERALLSCLAQMPGHAGGRVILLSDGRQTAGDVERIVPQLRRLGLEVYPIAVPTTDPAGVLWEQLAVPAVVQRGASVPLTLAFSNGGTRARAVEVTVSLRDLPLARRRDRLAPGWRILSLAVPTRATGTMPLDVSVTFDGEEPQRRAAYVEVEGPSKLLFVLEKPTELPPLATALKRREMELAVATPEEVPTEAGRLMAYDAVVFFHVPKSSLTEEQVEALERYLTHLGGGLVMVGLGGRLDEEIGREAPLDRLLPVRFEPKGVQEAKRRVCILLVIDRSASMMGPRIAATKRGAVELVKQLAPEDLVGVLAFDTIPYVVVEVQQARGVSGALIEKLVRLKSTGGTDILPALKAARDRLAASGATVKHIILLSDGMTPVDARAYQRLLDELVQQRITISTIGIGATFVNAELLNWLAEKTSGTFYQMKHLDELPQLVAQDTQQALGRLPFTEGYFRPTRTEASEWFADIRDWPALKGFLTATAKPGSTVELMIPLAPASGQTDRADAPYGAQAGQPLLARWSVGLGRVVAFTSDADTRWSPDWIRWPHFERVWAQIVRSSVRARLTEELFVWVDDRGPLPFVVVEGELVDPTAELVSPEGSRIPLALAQQGRFRWRAAVDHVPSGWHQLALHARHFPQPDGAERERPTRQEPQTAFAARWVQIGRPASEEERPHLPPDEALLQRIAQATHGAMEAPDRAFLPPSEWAAQTVPLRGWLLPLVIVLLLADVALRGRTLL